MRSNIRMGTRSGHTVYFWGHAQASQFCHIINQTYFRDEKGKIYITHTYQHMQGEEGPNEYNALSAGKTGRAMGDGQRYKGHLYICIDLKSFYASVECVERGLDPFTTNLVVADPERTEKTICLAITPAMKALGVPNRCRVFEIPQNIDYIMAKPRMKRYMEVSAQIYSIYLRYISAEDIHVYSVDECFIDITPYLPLYNISPKGIANMLRGAVFDETGICATVGIGTNLFLAKVALDVTAKHADDFIGFLDEETFAHTMLDYEPITDIWNIGPGIARRLKKYGVHTLRGVCEMREETLFKEFGINAELLIDHAHGYEPCRMEDIHSYVPSGHSLCSAQVLKCDYSFEEGLIILKEMVDNLVLDLIDKQLVTDSISLSVGYSSSAFECGEGEDGEAMGSFAGDRDIQQVKTGKYGPRNAATRKLGRNTNSRSVLMERFIALYREIVSPVYPLRRIGVGFGKVLPEEYATLTFFDDAEALEQEQSLSHALLDVKRKFGKNAIVYGLSFEEKATARERNAQVGGHHA